MKIQKSVLFVKKNLKINIWKIKNIWKLERSLSFYRVIGIAHSVCNLKYSVLKKNPIVFHNGSNHDYHFIIKRLAEEFKKQFTGLRENTEKYIVVTKV